MGDREGAWEDDVLGTGGPPSDLQARIAPAIRDASRTHPRRHAHPIRESLGFCRPRVDGFLVLHHPASSSRAGHVIPFPKLPGSMNSPRGWFGLNQRALREGMGRRAEPSITLSVVFVVGKWPL